MKNPQLPTGAELIKRQIAQYQIQMQIVKAASSAKTTVAK